MKQSVKSLRTLKEYYTVGKKRVPQGFDLNCSRHFFIFFLSFRIPCENGRFRRVNVGSTELLSIPEDQSWVPRPGNLSVLPQVDKPNQKVEGSRSRDFVWLKVSF